MALWFHCLTADSGSLVRSISERFLNAGIALHDFDLGSTEGHGLLFFDEMNQHVLDFLYETSNGCNGRILAVASSGAIPDTDDIWRMLQAGAADVLYWNSLFNPVEEVAARLERWNIVDRLMDSPPVRVNLIGESPVWQSVLRQVIEVACFTDMTVLIEGESGIGKEKIARLIHDLDQRAEKGGMTVLDCTTIVPELSGSELFGHERGAFTGAYAAREGAFFLADRGTLFLDEVGELPPDLQPRLLRVIQEHTYKRLGDDKWRRTEFRLISATNRDLRKHIDKGKFRHDLYYRIAGWKVKLPPLRERHEDILPLARYFMRLHVNGKDPPALDETVCQYLQNRQYPGNVRELEQLVSRIMCRYVGSGPVTIGFIPPEERGEEELAPTVWKNRHFRDSIQTAVSEGIRLKDIGRAAEDVAVRIAIDREKGEKGWLRRAACSLGITERALQARPIDALSFTRIHGKGWGSSRFMRKTNARGRLTTPISPCVAVTPSFATAQKSAMISDSHRSQIVHAIR